MRRYYWVQILWYFIPSSIIVMVTWLSFWWPAEIVNGRTILTIRSLVMISGIYSAARKKSPKTGYPDALDTWMTFIIFTGKSAYDIRLKDILRFEKYQRRAELVGRIGYPVRLFRL
ncbi:Glycine receptor subunit beta-type 4 [Armadillidium vulgare]|nr:Glycine receptor subunit beta-type 4 [Armadillidium vulgare]